MANIFVDPSATNNGDGTTAAQAASNGATGAFNTIVGITVNNGDLVWIRRKTLTVTANVTLSTGGVTYIGWPQSGDTYYGSRPASGTSNGWDADATGYAIITTVTNTITAVLIISGTGITLERIKVSNTSSSGTPASPMILDIQADCTINNCYFLANHGLTGSTGSVLNISTNNPVAKIISTTFENAATSPATLNVVQITSSNTNVEFVKCVFTHSGGSSSVANSYVLNATRGTLSFADCTFTENGTNPTQDCVAFSSTTSVVMYNCTIDSKSTAAQTQLNTPNSGVFLAQRTNLPRGRRIAVRAAGHYLHVSSFTQTVASSDYAVSLVAGCIFSCNNLTTFVGNSFGDIKCDVSATVLLQGPVFASGSPFGTTANILADIYIMDYNGTSGDWRFYKAKGQVLSSNVLRGGGESFSLQHQLVAGSQNYLGNLHSILNSFETIYATVTPTDTKVTIYGAYKLFSPAPDVNQIWADCDYLDAGSGTHRAYADTRGTPGVALTSDSSSWSGDSGLNKFKLEIPVAPGQTCLAPIRLFLNIRNSGGYVYFDPKPVVG